jgi:hypothetical protein
MIEWITSHWDEVLAVYGGLVAVCTIIVKWTPSTKDDELLGKIVNVLDKFSTSKKAKK